MAKRDGSKSSAIRDYITSNPNAKPKEILTALKARGIDVSVGLVSVVKYAKPKSGKKKPGRPKKAASTSSDLSADQLLAAKTLADSLGGIQNTREALDLIEKLG
jgi:hypothetical protein